MATLRAFSVCVGVISLLIAFNSRIAFSRQADVVRECPNHAFEDLYTCHSSPYDYTPGHSPGTWGPWDWGPVCFTPDGAPASYCLVSSADYNSNRGVSIIAQADFISQLQQAMSDDNVASAARPHLTPASGEIYEQTEIPGKGVGVVARYRITRGIPFMISLPGIILDNEFRGLIDTDANAQELYRRAVDQLTDRDRVMGLARSTGGEPLEDVMRTNAHIARVAGRNTAFVYPEVARINHACNPNSLVRFVPNKLMIEVVAIRDIAAGEEITITYIEDGLVSSDRKDSLAAFNFECKCRLCAADETSTSDRNRRRIQDILAFFDSIRKGYATIDLKDAQDLASEMLSLASEEDLGPSTMKRYGHDLMRIFFELGDVSSAMNHARRTLVLSEEFDGSEDADGLQRALRRNLEVLQEYLPVEGK